MNKIRLVLLYRYGRLGNQLFQISACRSIAPSASIFGVDLEQIDSFICGSRIITKPKLLVAAFQIVLRKIGRGRALRISGTNRLFTLIQEASDGYHIKPGLISSIAVIDGFFQRQTFNLHVHERLGQTLFYQQRFATPLTFRYSANSAVGSRKACFVHIRRGDYLQWPSLEYSAALGLSWYLKAIRSIRSEHANCVDFFVFSDEPSILKSFEGLESVHVKHGTLEQDFQNMSKCDCGILSASTLSWWVAYFIHRKNPSAKLIAPRFWAGWRKGEWFPSGIETNFLQYLDGE